MGNKPGTKLKRYCLTTIAGELTSYSNLTEAFEAGKQTDGFMVFDSQAQTGEIESWILRNGKWLASEICNMPDIPDRIMKMLY